MMDDCICRQAAIDAVGINTWAGQRLLKVPSAQPEITEQQVKKYCEKRCLVVLDSILFQQLKSAQPEITAEQVKEFCEERGFVVLTKEEYQWLKSLKSKAEEYRWNGGGNY